MLIRVGYEIGFELPDPTPMTFMLNILPSRSGDILKQDKVRVSPDVPVEEYIDHFGNRCTRILAPKGHVIVTNDAIVRDSGVVAPTFPDAVQHPVQNLPTDCLQFLLPSRYCEVDKLTDAAWELFGNLPQGWSLAEAIRKWVNEHIEFGYHHASPTKTAAEVYADKKGVCRDFTHLAVTLTRAMNIPARYATGYLGDIGVPPADSAMDFSACYQVYLGNQWHTFDARHSIRRIGWILMATGRDAADCAITTSFGPHILKEFKVWSDEIQALPSEGNVLATTA